MMVLWPTPRREQTSRYPAMPTCASPTINKLVGSAKPDHRPRTLWRQAASLARGEQRQASGRA